MKYDVFISHATEDKEDFVDPLATELQKCGLHVWYDRFVLTLGDSLRAKIDEGLRESRYGVVVLSPAFFEKQWARAELDALFTKQASGDEKLLLPVWHNMRARDVASESPLLASLYATNSSKGTLGVVADILNVVRPDSKRFATDGGGRFLCEIHGGPFAGVHVLLVDASEAPRGGPKELLKDDVIPHVPFEGKRYMAGLIRRPKLPHLLSDGDTWSLPLPNGGVSVTRHGPVIEIAIPYARYTFRSVHSQENGDLIPVFDFEKEEVVVARL